MRLPAWMRLASPRCHIARYVLATLLFWVSVSVNAEVPAKSEFTFRLQADPQTLDWTVAHTNLETYVLMNVMEGLVEIDRSLQPQPALALRWETSDGGLTYTFYLRPGVKWSDGSTLTAEDFIYSWHRLLAPGNTNEYTNFLFDVQNAEAFHQGKIKHFAEVGLKALDHSRLQIKLKRVVPYFVSLLSFWVTFPQRAPMNSKHLITLGPYLLERWEQGKQLVFKRNPTYYGAAPSVETVRAIIEPDDKKARQLFQSSQIDALLEVNTQDIANSPQKVLRQFDYLAVDFLAMNVATGPLSNLELRRAIALALDRSDIGAALQGGQFPAQSLIPRGIAGYDQTGALAVSVDEARRALLKAGYRSGSAVPPLTLVARQGTQADAAGYVRDVLQRQLGLKITVKGVAPGEFKKILKSEAFNLYVGHWGADYPDAASFMEIMLSTSANNYTNWKNVSYDHFVAKAGDTVEVLERLKNYAAAQKILLQRDVVLVPLFYPKITVLVSSAIAAFEVSPLNYLFFKRIVR